MSDDEQDVIRRADASFTRPTLDDVRARWSAVVDDPMLSREGLKEQALKGQVPEQGLRSLYWRVFLGTLPLSTSSFPASLALSRQSYDSLRIAHLRAPDGSYPSDVSLPSSHVHSATSSPLDAPPSLDVNNPLSLESNNPWQRHFAALELRKIIRQDVQRTFPDIPYFRIPRVQTSLTTILFLWCQLNDDVSYRQGMHELLAVIFLVIDSDALDPSAASSSSSKPLPDWEEAALRDVFSSSHVEADAWALFEVIMKTAKPWYEWKGSTTSILSKCSRVHDTLLRQLDPNVHARFAEFEVEPQIFLIRWIRLLFSREFALDGTLLLWDGLFADDGQGLKGVEWVAVAMLLRIRNQLVSAPDYSTFLTLLLRHPPIPRSNSSSSPSAIPLLLEQALFLRDSPTPASAAAVVLQNAHLLGIEVAETPPSSAAGSERSRPQQPHSRRGAAQLGLGEIAKGLMERSEALGINKAIISSISEIRKNLPEIQFPLPPPSSSSSASHPSSSPPLSNLPQYLPWEFGSPRELEAELAALRRTQRDLARALDGALGRLGGADESALGVVRHVRDVLAGEKKVKAALLVAEAERPELLRRNTTSPTVPVAAQPQPSASDPPPTSAAPPSSSRPAPALPLFLATRDDRPVGGLTRVPYRPSPSHSPSQSSSTCNISPPPPPPSVQPQPQPRPAPPRTISHAPSRSMSQRPIPPWESRRSPSSVGPAAGGGSMPTYPPPTSPPLHQDPLAGAMVENVARLGGGRARASTVRVRSGGGPGVGGGHGAGGYDPLGAGDA